MPTNAGSSIGKNKYTNNENNNYLTSNLRATQRKCRRIKIRNAARTWNEATRRDEAKSAYELIATTALNNNNNNCSARRAEVNYNTMIVRAQLLA